MRKTHQQVAINVESNGARGVWSSYIGSSWRAGHLLKTPLYSYNRSAQKALVEAVGERADHNLHTCSFSQNFIRRPYGQGAGTEAVGQRKS